MFNNKNNVVIENKELKNAIRNWLRSNGNICKDFGAILSSFAFSSLDNVYLYGYISETFTFKYYIKNSKQKGAIALVHGRMDKETGKYINPRIIFMKDDTRTIYECFRGVNGKILPKVQLIGIVRDISDDILCRCRYFNDRVSIALEKNDYSITLLVSNPNTSRKNMYKLENEEELINYLSSLEFPVKIDEVYKRICEISLGDINEYPDFSLIATRTNCYNGKVKTTDMIHLKNGNLEEFGITKNGKKIFIYKNGSWMYENFIDDVFVSVNCMNTVGLNYSFMYDFKSLNDKTDGVKLPFLDTIIMDDIEDVKKKARVLFK